MQDDAVQGGGVKKQYKYLPSQLSPFWWGEIQVSWCKWITNAPTGPSALNLAEGDGRGGGGGGDSGGGGGGGGGGGSSSRRLGFYDALNMSGLLRRILHRA